MRTARDLCAMNFTGGMLNNFCMDSSRRFARLGQARHDARSNARPHRKWRQALSSNRSLPTSLHHPLRSIHDRLLVTYRRWAARRTRPGRGSGVAQLPTTVPGRVPSRRRAAEVPNRTRRGDLNRLFLSREEAPHPARASPEKGAIRDLEVPQQCGGNATSLTLPPPGSEGLYRGSRCNQGNRATKSAISNASPCFAMRSFSTSGTNPED